jgi:hypothetical protein
MVFVVLFVLMIGDINAGSVALVVYHEDMGPMTQRSRFTFVVVVLAVFLTVAADAQVIDFESNGLHFKTLTKGGLTIMFAPLPSHVRSYTILQVAISNGSGVSWTVKPEDFLMIRPDGTEVRALAPQVVVDSLMEKAGRGDVVKLITTYEGGVYGNPNFKSTNGYETRRQNALAAFGSARIYAAAAASAIVFVRTKLNTGDTTDGAIFFDNNGKALGPGKIQVHAGADIFEYPLP